MGPKKSQIPDIQATALTTPTPAPQNPPLTPTTNRTRGRSTQYTINQSTVAKPSEKTSSAGRLLTESHQSEFAVPAVDTVRRSGRRTTLPKNLIHDSVIETPVNRHRRGSVPSENLPRRNSSSSNKLQRKKQLPRESMPPKEEQPVVSNIKLKDQILTSSDEEFPPSYNRKGSLYGYKRLPPMSPPPGPKTWETDSEQEERRGNRGNLGWGPMKVKEKKTSMIEDSQEEGDTSSVSPQSQPQPLTADVSVKSALPASLMIESDDSDRDYDAELSELDSSPVSVHARRASEVPQTPDVDGDLPEQRPSKRRRLLPHDGSEIEKVDDLNRIKSVVTGASSTNLSPPNAFIDTHADIDVGMQDGEQSSNRAENQDDVQLEGEGTMEEPASGTGGREKHFKINDEVYEAEEGEPHGVSTTHHTTQVHEFHSDVQQSRIDLGKEGLEIQRENIAGRQEEERETAKVDSSKPSEDLDTLNQINPRKASENTGIQYEATNGLKTQDQSDKYSDTNAKIAENGIPPANSGDEPAKTSGSEKWVYSSSREQQFPPKIEEVTDKEDLCGSRATLENEKEKQYKPPLELDIDIFIEEDGECQAVEPDEVEDASDLERVPLESGGHRHVMVKSGLEIEVESDMEGSEREYEGEDLGKRRGWLAKATADEIVEAGEEIRIVSINEECTDSLDAEENVGGSMSETRIVERVGLLAGNDHGSKVCQESELGPTEDTIETNEVVEVGRQEPPVRKCPLDDMDVDEKTQPATESECAVSGTPTEQRMEDTGVGKFRELSLDADDDQEPEKVEPGPSAGREIAISEICSKNGDLFKTTTTLEEVEVINSRIEGDVLHAVVKTHQRAETTPNVEKKYLETESHKDISGSPVSNENGIESGQEDDEIMGDAQDPPGDIPTKQDDDQELPELLEKERATEQASETAEDVHMRDGEDSTDDRTTESQAAEDATVVTAKQEKEQRSIEQQTEEHQKESAAPEPRLPPELVDDLGAEAMTITDDDDHITLYSSSPGLSYDEDSDHEGGLTKCSVHGKRPRSIKRGNRIESWRREKPSKQKLKGIIDDQEAQPQLDIPSFDSQQWISGNYDQSTRQSSEEPPLVAENDNTEGMFENPLVDPRDQQGAKTDSPEPIEEDNLYVADPEINEDVGLPPDLEVPASDGSTSEEYDKQEPTSDGSMGDEYDNQGPPSDGSVGEEGDQQEPAPDGSMVEPVSYSSTSEEYDKQESTSDGSKNEEYDKQDNLETQLSGNGLMDLLYAAELVENGKALPLKETRKVVLPSRTFKMFGDAWERKSNELDSRLIDSTSKPTYSQKMKDRFPDNIVNLSDWEGVPFNKCPVCCEPLTDLALAAIDHEQCAQNVIAEHVESCEKHKSPSESSKVKSREVKNRDSKTPAPATPVRASEGVRRINLRVKLSDGTYFQNPSQPQPLLPPATTPVETTITTPVRPSSPSLTGIAAKLPQPPSSTSITAKLPQPPSLASIAAKLPQTASEYAKILQDIEQYELQPNTREIFKQLTGEKIIHSDSEDSLPDAYEYDPEECGADASKPLPDEAYFMKNTSISVFQSRSQESFKRSYDHAFAEQENIIAVMAQLQAEYFELEEEVAAREHRMPKRLRPLSSHVVFEDKKEADLYNYKYDPDPKKRGRQDPDAQRTDSVYVGGRELRGRARNREGVAAEFLQGRRKRLSAPGPQATRPTGARGPGRPRKEVLGGTDSGVTSMQQSRDASLDATAVPQVSPVKRGKLIRNPRGYNGRNKRVSLPPTREQSPTPAPQPVAATLPKRRGRKSNAEKAKEAEAALAIAEAQAAMEEPAKEIVPKSVPITSSSLTGPTRRISTRTRKLPVAVENSNASTSELAPQTPSATTPERRPPKPPAARPTTPKPDSTKIGMTKAQATRPVGRRQEILKLRMSSRGSAKAERILSPKVASCMLDEEKLTEITAEKEQQKEEALGLPQDQMTEEALPPVSADIDLRPTAPESFYGNLSPNSPADTPNPLVLDSPPNVVCVTSSPASCTILPQKVSPQTQQPQLQFMPNRVVSTTPAPASPVMTGTSPASSVPPRQFFGNASRRARRGEFINSGVNNDLTPYKTYASGKVVGNAPIQMQMQDRAPSPEESRSSVPPPPTPNLQLDFVMDMTVPQQYIPGPMAVAASTPQPSRQSPSTTMPIMTSTIIQPLYSAGVTKPRGRGGKGSSSGKGGGQSTFLPTITPDNWRLKKGVRQPLKTEITGLNTLREGSVFRDMSRRSIPATSAGNTRITASAPSFQTAELTGSSNHSGDWTTRNLAISNMTMPSIPTSGIVGRYIHPQHTHAIPTLPPFIKPPVDSPPPPYHSHSLPPIQHLNFVAANPGEPKQRGTRGKTYKKPTMGFDVWKPTKEDEFRELTKGQMDLGKRKRRIKGSEEGTIESSVAEGHLTRSMVGGIDRIDVESPKRVRLDPPMHMGVQHQSRYTQDMDMFQTPPPPPQLPLPPPLHGGASPMQFYGRVPSEDLSTQHSVRNHLPHLSMSHSDSQDTRGSEESPAMNSEEKVSGNHNFRVSMWTPPTPGTIGA